MASALQRVKLARAALHLNARCGALLPPLVLMTDDVRLPDPLGAARALPRGSLVIVRAIDRGARTQLATRMMALSRTRDLIVLIAADAALASTVEADGLHLPEAHMRDALHWRALRPRWLVTVAAHSLCGLMRAHAAGADAAILSPVFATASHPQAPTLGPLRLRALARQSPVPVYALGGVDAMSAPRLVGAPVAGLAAVAGLAPPPR